MILLHDNVVISYRPGDKLIIEKARLSKYENALLKTHCSLLRRVVKTKTVTFLKCSVNLKVRSHCAR